MLALKAAAAAGLAATLFAVLSPSWFQEAGPGKPDDVAQLLPEETLGFVELVKAPRIFHDWKEYVGGFTTADGKEKLCAFIDEWFTKTIEIIPERILKDLKEGLPSIQRMAVALTSAAGDEVPWVLIVTSTDAAFCKKLVEEDMAVFSSEERTHNGVKVLAIRKMGELKSEHPVYVAAPGPRLIVTTRWASMTDVLDRAAGKGAGPDLRSNRLYAQLAPAAADDPTLRAFCSLDFEALTGGGFEYMSRRYTRAMMDQVDAVFGFRKIGGLIVEATFKPGRVASTCRMPVKSPCRIYDALRQPPGPKDLLVHLPKRTMFFAHANLKSGKDVWADVESFMRRYQEAERKMRGRPSSDDYVEEINRESKKELGVSARDLAGAVGNEVLFALSEPAEGPDFMRMFLILFRAVDSAKAREILETIAKTTGKLEAVTEGKITLFKPKAEKDDPPAGPAGGPILGIRDTVVAFGGDEATVKEALAAEKDASGASSRLPKDASTSALLGVHPQHVIDFFLKMSGVEKPEVLTHLKADDWSITASRTDKDGAVLSAADAGYGAMLHTALTGLPMLAFTMRSMFMQIFGGGPGMPEPPMPKPAPEPAKLPAEELAKRTGDLIPQLRSDELTVREKASSDLKALGRQAVPLLIAAYKAEKDPEARSRLAALLADHNAWDVLPELLDRKVDSFFDEFRASMEGKEEHDWWGGYSTWNGANDSEMHGIEPTVRPRFIARLNHAEVVAIPAALKRFAERLKQADLAPPKKGQVVALLAYNDCGPACPVILELLQSSTDPESRGLLTAALGWSADAKAKETVFKSFESKDLSVRRGAFMAAERMRDPAAATKLLDLAKDPDFETRWNAGYTLVRLTNGKIELNAFLPDDEYDPQVKAARAWWEENKGSFKFQAPSFK